MICLSYVLILDEGVVVFAGTAAAHRPLYQTAKIKADILLCELIVSQAEHGWPCENRGATPRVTKNLEIDSGPYSTISGFLNSSAILFQFCK